MDFGSERNHLGHQVLLTQSTKLWNKEKTKMNKKILLGILGIALVAAIAAPAMMDTWTSCMITMHAGTGDVANLACFSDCLCTQPVTTVNFGALSQDQDYETSVYVCNIGNKAL